MPKGIYERTPENIRKPREYPAEIVELARRLYVDEGMTVAEIRAVFPRGYRVQTILERHVPKRRTAAKRDQSGPRNSSWRGDAPSYAAAHTRVYALRGSASQYACVDCAWQAKDWSYTGGCPREQLDPGTGCAFSPDPDRYQARCRSCHRAYDRRMRGEAA